jgi:hypothetical protein
MTPEEKKEITHLLGRLVWSYKQRKEFDERIIALEGELKVKLPNFKQELKGKLQRKLSALENLRNS